MRLLTTPLRTAGTLASGAVHVARGGISLVEATVRKHVPGVRGNARPQAPDRADTAPDTARATPDVGDEQEQIAEALIDEMEEHRRILGDDLVELDEEDQIAQAELMAKHRAQELEEERRRKEAEDNTTAS